MKSSISEIINRVTTFNAVTLSRILRNAFGVLALLCCITACKDDDLMPYNSTNVTASRAYSVADSKVGLIPQDDGTYRATRRIPLVGQGRIIDNLMNSLVTVGATDTHAENVVDLDLTNTAIPRGNAVGATVTYNSILSVRDINYVYSGGQKAGFVVKQDDSGLLTAELLKGFTLATYLRGNKQEEKAVIQNSGLLDLGLGKISVNDSKTVPFTLEAEFSKPFDEIRLSNSGVQADAGTTGIEIYYAFVGETPMIKAINDGNEYFKNECSGKFDGVNNSSLVDANIGNGPTIFLISAGTFEVDFGQEVPANSEVGFYLTSAHLLELDVAGTVAVQTLGSDGETVLDQMSTTTVVNLGLAKGGAITYSLTTSKPCYGVKIIFGGLPVDIGGTQCHYAFVREPVVPDISSFFTFANATVYTPGYHFPRPKQAGATVTYTIESQPSGAAAEIRNDKGIIWNMNVAGNYVVKATYRTADGQEFVETATITRKVRVDSDCNQKLINNVGGPELYEAYIPDGWGLDIGGGEKTGIDNVVDASTNNYFEIGESFKITLVQNRGIAGVRLKNGGNIAKGDGNEMRVGFVVNKNETILKADVLNFFRIRLLKNKEEVESGVAEGAISVSLIDVDESNEDLTRFSMHIKKTDIDFDAMELYYTGVADVDIASSIKVYYAFVDYDVNNCADPGQECLQLITNGSHSATASFDVKGLATVGITVTNLGNMVDGRLDSYATVVKPVDLATETIITTKFDEIPGGTPVGFVLRRDLDMIKLIDVLQIKAYYNDVEVAGSTAGGALNVTLGSDDYEYIYITPDKEKKVDRLDLIIGSGADIGKGMNICGIFSRPDLDENGMYDCLDDTAETGIHGLLVRTKDLCSGDVPTIEVEGGEDKKVYYLTLKSTKSTEVKFNVNVGHDGYIMPTDDDNANYYKFFEDEANCGIYTVRLSSDLDPQGMAANDPLRIHPKNTTWTGAVSNDWNDWDNWDNGMPLGCTNVVIPSPEKLNGGNTKYPVLQSKNGNYYCQNIHFEPGAMLKGQQFLNYTKAFVDVKIKGGDYHLMSSPLQDMVTGDMFVNTGWTLDGSFTGGKWNKYDPYFADLNETSYKENRTNPIVYQRFWNETVKNETMSRSVSDLLSKDFDGAKDWTRSFNDVSDKYDRCHGFAIRIGADGVNKDLNYTLHFPKSHKTYNYYDANGNLLKPMPGTIRRDNSGKFWNFDNQVDVHSVLVRRSVGKFFLCGNPFISRINIAEFLKDNESSIVAVYRYKDGKYEKVTGYIEPMEAVFIEAKSPAGMLTVDFNYDALDVTATNTTN